MGCSGSKNQVQSTANLNQKVQNPEIVKNETAKEDEEALIVQSGKTVKKSELDELTEKSGSIINNKNKSVAFVDQDESSNKIVKENHSKSVYVERIEDDKYKTDENKEINHRAKEVSESAETIAGKSKTVKVEFEKHPHEFDFSYIEEQDKDKDDKEKDLFTDQVLKEISEIN